MIFSGTGVLLLSREEVSVSLVTLKINGRLSKKVTWKRSFFFYHYLLENIEKVIFAQSRTLRPPTRCNQPLSSSSLPKPATRPSRDIGVIAQIRHVKATLGEAANVKPAVWGKWLQLQSLAEGENECNHNTASSHSPAGGLKLCTSIYSLFLEYVRQYRNRQKVKLEYWKYD